MRFVNYKNDEHRLADRFADIDTLYNSLGLSKVKGNIKYVVMPISSGEHISTLIFDMTKNKNEEGFMLSFDTMGDDPNGHMSKSVFDGFNVTPLNTESTQKNSGYTYLTAYFCESILKYDSIVEIKQNIEKIKKEIVGKFENLKQSTGRANQQPIERQKPAKQKNSQNQKKIRVRITKLVTTFAKYYR